MDRLPKVKLDTVLDLIDYNRDGGDTIQIVRFDGDFDEYDTFDISSNILHLIRDVNVTSISAINEMTFRLTVDWESYLREKYE